MQKQTKKHHVQAIVVASVLMLMSTISMTSASVLCTDYKAYLSPQQAGFISADETENAMQESVDANRKSGRKQYWQKKICRDPETGQIRVIHQRMAVQPTAKERSERVQQIIQNAQQEIADIRSELTEADEDTLHASAPEQQNAIWTVIHEIARWFGLQP